MRPSKYYFQISRSTKKKIVPKITKLELFEDRSQQLIQLRWHVTQQQRERPSKTVLISYQKTVH
jgi:hypothetical protein